MERLAVRDLVKAFKKRKVVDGVSMEVAPGEIVGLLGPNGAGKTTTFYMTVGLVTPDKGSVHLGDKEITGLPMYERARRGISYLPQEASVFRKLTVEENISAVLDYQGLARDEYGKRRRKLLEELGVLHLSRVKAYALSGGERRRVEIARALVNDPSFMLLDEPFSGIDPIAVGDIQEIMLELRKKDIGILVTDHNVGATLGICDRAYIIGDGQIIEQGSPTQIIESKRVREVYLGDKFKM